MRQTERLVRYILSAGLALVSVAPFLFMLLISLEHHRFIGGNPLDWFPAAPTLSTYGDVLMLSGFGRWFFNSLVVAVVSTLALLLVQSMAAYALAHKRFAGRDLLFYFILGGLMVPGAMTLVPLFLIARDLGLLNSYAGLILPTLAGPLGVFLLRQYMLSIPPDLLDAARIDGCSEAGVYWRVVLPLSLPAVGTLAVISFTANWSGFLWPLLVAGDDTMKTLPVGLASLGGQFSTDYGAQMAGALLSVLPVLVVFLALQRYFIRGLTAGALKG
jgi:multiple sugar transport system permease protein